MQLSYLLVGDGTTDAALTPIINWAIHDHAPALEILEPEFRKRPGSLNDYLATLDTGAMLVFAHRDSERETLEERLREFAHVTDDRVVPVIPVRMTEAWLLIDEAAIARAADHPHAHVALPAVRDLENISDPKARLEELLLHAAGDPTGRRRKRFQRLMVSRRMNVAEFIADYRPLMNVSAFMRFHRDLDTALTAIGILNH